MLDVATLNVLGRKLRHLYAKAARDELPDRLRALLVELQRPRPAKG